MVYLVDLPTIRVVRERKNRQITLEYTAGRGLRDNDAQALKIRRLQLRGSSLGSDEHLLYKASMQG